MWSMKKQEVVWVKKPNSRHDFTAFDLMRREKETKKLQNCVKVPRGHRTRPPLLQFPSLCRPADPNRFGTFHPSG
ncbi:hypothetical protein EK904_008455 [Melospiza melodia maxima]|nr:hypothetical protein EK904_008455 [Melospiza melodia maxima]